MHQFIEINVQEYISLYKTYINIRNNCLKEKKDKFKEISFVKESETKT